jgi:hypothetical protein
MRVDKEASNGLNANFNMLSLSSFVGFLSSYRLLTKLTRWQILLLDVHIP